MSGENGASGGILTYFTRHRTAATLLMVVMLALGLVAASKIRSQFFPDVVIDTVTVTVNWDGAGPEELDTSVVAQLDPALSGVEGVTTSSATSKEGSTTITLTFEPGWDLARATDEVKAAVDSIRNLPEGTEEPVIRRGVWKDKVTEVVISGPISPDQLGRIGDEFVSSLYRAGITRTVITGVSAPQISVAVPEVARVRNDLALKDVADAISAQIATRPAGDVGGGATRLRAGEESRDIEDIRNMVIRVNPDGSKLYVRNVATVSVTGSDAGRAYYLDDQPAVLIRVDRTAEGDAIGMEATVRQLAEDLGPTLPDGVGIRLINARAQDITDRLDILMSNGLQGLVLVLITLFLFLSARTAFWVAMGIPVSMLAAIGVMFAAGYTINMMSLFALIITLGIIVDDAIVVAEHADFRARKLGESPETAPVNAVRRMLAPIFSSTTTTILAFIGLLFVGGAFGRLINEIPVVVAAVLFASLVESFLILPNHMRHALHAGRKESWFDKPSIWFNRGFSWVAEKLFTPVMRAVIALRYVVIAAMVLALAFSASAIMRGDVPWSFFTAPEAGSVTGNFAFLPGASREDARDMAGEMARAVDAVAKRIEEESGVYPVVHALTQIGGTAAKGLPGQETMDPDTLGSIDIGLVDADKRNFSAQDFVRELNQEVVRPAGLALMSFRTQGAGPGGDSLAVNFYGSDSFALKAAATDLIAALGQYPEVTGLQDSLPYGREDSVLELTPAGQALGFTTEAVGSELSARLNGIVAATFPAGTRSTNVTVGLQQSELGAGFLDNTLMRAPTGAWVPLSEIVTVKSSVAFSTVNRENGRRLVTVTGALAEGDAERASEIATTLRTDILPEIADRHGLDWDLGGLAVQEQDFLSEAIVGFLLCVLGIYLVLGWVFGSWATPLVVMSVIPFGLIGAVWGHAQFGLAMSLFTVIGLIGMSGIIINDAIVLVTTIKDYARTRPILAAAVDGARDRLRPILLTTLTTVLGLAPLMYEESRQSLFLKPTVVTLVYGLSVGFFIVLAMIPSLMVVQHDISRAMSSLRRALLGRHASAGVRTGAALSLLAIAAVDAAILVPWALTGTALPPLAAVAGDVPAGVLSLVAAIVASVVIAAGFAAIAALLRRRPEPAGG